MEERIIKDINNLLTQLFQKMKEAGKPTETTDLRTWKYIVDAVLTEREGIGQYIDSPWTTEVAEKLQKRFGNIEQKPAWSEEDEYYRHQLIVFCENCMQQDSGAIRCANWLKSLSPQNHWKPSDEQIEALDIAIRCGIQLGTWEEDALKSLAEQLKKLKEE